jgi:hypothetical protein
MIMKQVLDSKVYNTETADRIHYWSNELPYDDFDYCGEALYKTKKGAWFIHCRVGARSPYSRAEGKCYFSDERLIQLTDEEAFKWLQEHEANADLIQELFPDLVEEA